MKKITSVLLLSALLGYSAAFAQTNAPSATDTNLLSSQASGIFDLLTTGSNYYAAPFFTMSTKSRDFGAGVAVGYKVSESINPLLRVDDFAHKLYVVSGNLELQPPKSLMGKFPITPFAVGGVATTLGGNGSQNGGLSGVIGAGVYFEWSHLGNGWLAQHAFTAVDYERWFNLPENQQNQIRFAPLSLRF